MKQSSALLAPRQTANHKMGNEQMSPWLRKEELGRYAKAVFESEDWHGIGIDSSLLRYSGLNSIQVLDGYRDGLLHSGGLRVDIIEKLGSALGDLKYVPNSVGLGALVISMILEAVGSSLGKQTMGTAEMLQRVFAHEKANEVRDLMEEYLKRLRINLGRPQLQLAETRKIENSMLMDGHMNSRLLKQWVNGAAFHTQMLIHQARLEGAGGSRAVQAAGLYQQQLNLLLEKYKSYLQTVIFAYVHTMPHVSVCCLYYTEYHGWWIFSEIVECFNKLETYCFTESEIVEAMFSKRQIRWAYTYFSNLATKIPTLVRQNGTFHIQTIYTCESISL